MIFRVIDIETTGTDGASDGICEIACVDLKNTSDGIVIADRMEYVTNPGKPIPPEVSAVHHLLDEDVKHFPPVERVIDLFKGADYYIAHRCEFERSFLDRYFGEQKWICTYKAALRIWPDAPGHSNQVLRYWRGHANPFGESRHNIDPHRALSDCLVTAAIFSDIATLSPLDELVKWSAEPALFTKIGFGKHRGTRYEDVPSDYLEWIIHKSDLDADTKHNAKVWLEKRRAKK